MELNRMMKVAFAIFALVLTGSAFADNQRQTVSQEMTFADLQINEPSKDMDELVKKSIYENDRRFSRVG
jgi:outer membrane lipopolysaccharide assembly protein LptE/RlpB